MFGAAAALQSRAQPGGGGALQLLPQLLHPHPELLLITAAWVLRVLDEIRGW